MTALRAAVVRTIGYREWHLYPWDSLEQRIRLSASARYGWELDFGPKIRSTQIQLTRAQASDLMRNAAAERALYQ